MYRMTNYSNWKLCLAFKNQANRGLKLAHVPIGSVPAFITIPMPELNIMVSHRSFSDPLQHIDRANSNLVGQSTDGEANDSL